MARNRYVKVFLTAAVPYDLSGCTVVGHTKSGDSPSLLLERPEAKPRARTATRKPRTAKAPAQPAAAGNSATAFPGSEAARG